MKSFKNECEALRHENFLLSRDVAAVTHSRGLIRAKLRAARYRIESLTTDYFADQTHILSLERQLGEARADNEAREKLVAELRQKIEDLSKPAALGATGVLTIFNEHDAPCPHGRGRVGNCVKCFSDRLWCCPGACEHGYILAQGCPTCPEPNARILQIVAAELDRMISGGLRLHKNEVKRIRDMIPIPAQEPESAA